MIPPSRFSRRAFRHDADLYALWQVNKYLWMSIAFVLVYLIVAQEQHLFTAPGWVVWLLFGCGLADGGARSWLAYRRGGSLPDAWAWLFTYLDITLIACAIALTGGIRSDLWMLYFVVMIFESLYARPVVKRLMDVNISVAYLLATLPLQLMSATPLPAAIYTLVLASRLFFIILVSALARRISVNAAARDQELLRLREEKAISEERARIAREVHDGLGHALVSSILRLELCARLITRAPEEAAAILKEEVPALRAAWNEGRDLAFHLRPWEMQTEIEGGLTETLRRHIGRFAERTGIRVDLKVETEGIRLRPEAAFGLTRMVQEALTNTAKHAQATTIEVTLQENAQKQIVCTLCDNGKGFDPAATEGGFGMSAMRERAKSLGGSVVVESAPGCGAKIVLTLPT